MNWMMGVYCLGLIFGCMRLKKHMLTAQGRGLGFVEHVIVCATQGPARLKVRRQRHGAREAPHLLGL